MRPTQLFVSLYWQARLAQPTLGVAAPLEALLLLLSEKSAGGTRLQFLSVCSLSPVASGGAGCTRLQHLRLCPAFCPALGHIMCCCSVQIRSAAAARYGAEQGRGEVREALCQRFYTHVGRKAGEIFVSDGSKCDIGRLQMMFGAGVSVAVQVRHAPLTCRSRALRAHELCLSPLAPMPASV